MNQIQPPRRFTVVDPRTAEGNPYEVAERSLQQILGIVKILEDSLKPARLMARNAALERQIDLDQRLDADGWPDTAEGRRWQKIEDTIAVLKADIALLTRVASFNPKKAR